MQNQLEAIKKFVKPFYLGKDIMHDLTHIKRIHYVLNDLEKTATFNFDQQLAEAALYFHGIIYSHEALIREYLLEIGLSREKTEMIIKIAWESQKEHKPTTNEGLILHDAHMLEGGRNFEIIKALITGSGRNQSLEETMLYIEKNVLKKGHCYTEEGKKRYAIMKNRTIEIFDELNIGLGRVV